MPAPIDPMKLREAMRALGVLPEDLEALQRLPVETALAQLEALKERVRKNFRTLSKSLHPDVTGGDREKTERFSLYATVKAEFDKLQIQPRAQPKMVQRPAPVRPQIQVTRVIMWSAVGPAYTQAQGRTTTGQTIVFNVPLRVATMKPT